MSETLVLWVRSVVSGKLRRVVVDGYTMCDMQTI